MTLDWSRIAAGSIRDDLVTLAGQRFAAHGRLDEWRDLLATLPTDRASTCELASDTIRIGRADDLDPQERRKLEGQLRQLIPWRKGPFDIFGITIDTEWRSDWKWQRVMKAGIDWKGARVCDVGCGSGYHLLRAVGAGATCAVGVEPMTVFQVQFAALEQLARPHVWPAVMLPVRDDALPDRGLEFDVILSMGVIYHHRQPRAHLQRLWQWTGPGGTLLLESIVVDAPEGLVPDGRYARMRNVPCIPSVALLTRWLHEAGFERVNLIDRTATTTLEQRTTHWMPWESLAQALDPSDPTRTVEGHPAPVRALLAARRC